ncbi:hypothetical protein M0811_03278 [Anaeramoeba ignava]|uniref:Uncharacterized protein n=1 Tax=Anaeramoeba ignava TaxID=1746090 RepID=A0A9Q0L714_ANAIG|nr:hypothetical protein M0811_03278 [Anaeramoeba ignava]
MISLDDDFAIFSSNKIFEPPNVKMGQKQEVKEEKPHYSDRIQAQFFQDNTKPTSMAVTATFVANSSEFFHEKTSFDSNSMIRKFNKMFKDKKITPEMRFIGEWIEENESEIKEIFSSKSPSLILTYLLMNLLKYYENIYPPFAKKSALDTANSQTQRLSNPKRTGGQSGRRPPSRKKRK